MTACAAACATQAFLDDAGGVDAILAAADSACYVLLEGGNVTASSISTCTSETDLEGRRGKASLFSISANLVMSGLGAGILSLPWAMAGAAIVPSVLTTLLVMALNAATIMILVYAAERHQVFDLGALLGHLPGRIGPIVQWLNNGLTWFSVYLTLVGYIVVMADSMEPLTAEMLGLSSKDPENFWSVRAPLLAASCMVVLPICFVDQQKLAVSSIVGICVTVYLFVVVAILFAKFGVAPDCCITSGIHEGTLTMFSTLMQCVIVQMCVLPMYEELENRSPRRFGMAVGSAFFFLAILFSAFSAVAYIVFGPSVNSNVMAQLPDDVLGAAARVGMTLVMLAVFPIMMMSMVAPVRHWEEKAGRTHGYVTVIVSVAIVVASAAGAAYFTNLGALNAMNGALQVFCFIGLAPGLAGLYLLGPKGVTWHATMYVLIVLSTIVTVIGCVYTDNAVGELQAACSWSTQ